MGIGCASGCGSSRQRDSTPIEYAITGFYKETPFYHSLLRICEFGLSSRQNELSVHIGNKEWIFYLRSKLFVLSSHFFSTPRMNLGT